MKTHTDAAVSDSKFRMGFHMDIQRTTLKNHGEVANHTELAAFSPSEERSREYPVGGAVAQPAREYTSNGEIKR